MYLKKAYVASFLLMTSLPVVAQEGEPGFDIGWGSGLNAIPLGGWATALITLSMLVTAGIFFKQRKAGGGVAAVVLSASIAVIGYQQDVLALPSLVDRLIDSPSGSDFLSCIETDGWEISTNQPNGIVFTRIEPNFGLIRLSEGEPLQPKLGGTCSLNDRLMPGETCTLECSFGEIPIDQFPQ
ncbi:hypothetical protein [Halopseudomonas salegens]|uniref:Midcut-by-XrtH protein n=1 Tax=Halopseudomonas salegens TaxID=1434072 RepID=A0A1H2FNT4_9GAMM|nr:hypothetical protein [Halopseudomonas salegens]SDU09037.1 hypothetical protein SAMN05216210_1697 [Halopseudomonas salegens]